MSTINSSQRWKGSPALVYYMKNDNGDYCCDIFKQSTPSRDLMIKRDKTGSTMALWKHLEKFHHSIYRDLKPLGTQNPLTNFFPKKSKYSGRTQELTKERCIDLIINTDTAFSTLEHPQFEAFVRILHNVMCPFRVETHYDVSSLQKIDDKKEKMRQLFRPIEKVSLTIDTWTTTNHLAIIAITIHYWWLLETSWMCSCCQRVAWISWRCIHDKSVTWSARRLQFDG